MIENSIKISFVGDFCSKSPKKIKLSNSIKEVLEGCNSNVLNFEGPLAKGDLNIPNKTILNQSDFSPEWCEQNNFNIISLANNHALDFGEKGLLETKKEFKKATVLGAGNWTQAYDINILEIDSCKIGFIAAASSDFASLKDPWTDKSKIGSAWINSIEVNNLIVKNKNNCDFIFVISHGGLEYMNLPLPEWRDRYRELIDLGADAVIGSHPHVPQGVEVYKNKPICYSLGNFYFDNNSNKLPKFWDNGLMVIFLIKIY